MSGDERTLLGILVVTVGGEEIELPKLKLRAAREWRRRALAAYSHWSGIDVRADALDEAGAILDEVETTMLDLIADYDRTGALGGREALEERVLPNEIAPLFMALLGSTLPFDLAAQLAAGAQVSPRSTNGRSPTGVSTPTPSRSGSTPAS